MSDLKQYVEKRKARDPEFAESYEAGYLEFKIGVLLRQAREEVGLTPGPFSFRFFGNIFHIC